ncbi:MAG: histidine kinase N-terminal 7TM domain-containing protein [Clostridia bacterium]
MLKIDVSFVLLHISTLMIISLLVFMLFMKKKKQLHYVFLLNIFLVFIWSLGHILEVYTTLRDGYTNMVFVNIYYFGLCFLPVSLLYTGLVFVRTRLKFSFRDILLLIFPVVDYIIIATNNNHNLFFTEYSIFNDVAQYGPYLLPHTIISYIYIIAGLSFLLHFSIKNSGFFSKQSVLIMAGIAIPFITNIMVTFNMIRLPVYFTPITFSFAIICFALAIFKFKFLNIVPIALQRIVDLISDSYIIIDSDWQVIDYNRTFTETFKGIFKIDRNINALEAFDETDVPLIKSDNLKNANIKAIESNTTVKYETNFIIDETRLYFNIELTPIFSHKKYLATIILIKDITELKNQMEELRRSQEILMEKERLASLGNLIGGIAHNLKTPIMTISGVSKTLEALGEEYRDSIDDPEVTPDDHREIAAEIIEWTNKIAPYCSYMSEMISAVKGQAVQLATNDATVFTLYELLSRINILMRFELKKFHCELRQDTKTSIYNEMKGDLSILVQVFNNIITNAIQSYHGKEGVIDFKISSGNGRILFVITDRGVGIPEKIKKKLFKEMVTTKGRDGTGLGMYMAHSTIRGHFNGRLSFESEVGKGTTFYIEIPIYKEVSDEKK